MVSDHRSKIWAVTGKLGGLTDLSSPTVSDQYKLEGRGRLCARCLSHLEKMCFVMFCGVSDVK